MAGNYPDAPGARIALDLEGAILWSAPGGVVSQASAPTLASLQLDYGGSWNMGANGVTGGVIFPCLYDIVGVYMKGYTGYSAASMETSANTTTGLDGTWTSRGNYPGSESVGGANPPGFRTAIQSVTWNGIRAMRFNMSGGSFNGSMTTLHFYGSPTTGENPDRLRAWHPTLDQPLSQTPSYLDFGDIQRGITATKQFRIKNNSATLSAPNVVATLQAPTDASPSLVGQYAVSYNGGSFGSSCTLGTLTSGQISQLITLRRATSGTAALGIWTARISLTADPFV